MLLQFAKYNQWANSLLLAALKANAVAIPQSSVKLFSHILNAQMIWLYRINNQSPNVGVWQVHDLDSCSVLLAESAAGLEAINYAEERIIQYSNSTGAIFETSVADILLHVFNHGTYHRAQIAKEMKQHNIEPINTDYIQFVRLKC